MGRRQNAQLNVKPKTNWGVLTLILPFLLLISLSGLILFFPHAAQNFSHIIPTSYLFLTFFILSIASLLPILQVLRQSPHTTFSAQHCLYNKTPSFITDQKGRLLFSNLSFQETFPNIGPDIDDLVSVLQHAQDTQAFQEYIKDIQTNQSAPEKSFTFSTEGNKTSSLQLSCTPHDTVFLWTLTQSTLPLTVFNETPFQKAIDFNYLFNRTPSGNIILDQEGNIQGMNETFKENFLKENNAPIGSAVLDLLAPSCAKDLNHDIISLLQTKEKGAAIELEFSWGDNVLAYISPLHFKDHNQDYQGYYLQFFDNNEQRTIQLRLSHSQKLQALGQLAGGIAHDFNNLLTAMIGFCDLLLMRLSPGDQSFTDIMQIKQNANRATNLVRQLLAFSRQQTLQPTVLDVSEVLSDLSILLQRLIGSRIELKITHDRAVDFIKVDRSQFEQVIINLVVNAKDAIIGEGTVRLITKLRTLDKPTALDHETLPAGTYIQIEVIDDGQGISRKILERVFDPFFSTKDIGEGTGLGLATAYGTVKQTEGHISVDSTVGVGTKFTILLPQYTPNNDEKPKASTLTDLTTPLTPFKDLTGQGRILLVEDEDAVRLFAARALTDKGYTVEQAQHGQEALNLLKAMHKANEAAPDLLITDVVMPKMDGPTLVKEAEKLYPHMKVIYISGYAEDAFRDMVRLEEKIRFLAKPFSLKILASRVKETLEKPQAADSLTLVSTTP